MHQLLLQIIPPFGPSVGDLGKQGPVITLLLVAVAYFWRVNQAMAATIKANNDKHDAQIQANTDRLETYMKDDREKLLTAINNNSAIMQEIKEFMAQQKYK